MNSLRGYYGLRQPDEKASFEESEDNCTNKWIEKLLGRRQKSETELASCPPEKLRKEESSSNSGISSGGLALSTLSLMDTDISALSSLWETSKWSLKPDFQALSSAALPIFDGLPKPISRKNKAALD
ncbi:hypothetical protein SASPL_107429 [Salvia splendens]|uniref:Uncharacterized protein n=1 Tax=Salvia splendens TaxID=180675 RepID=A0A8X8YCW6_SALSN|nr:hypothetical protein SASPL_107429 [Salvia splendens]